MGDLFEGFLDQGVKQSEGQFFTPLPIVRFIVSSLPIEALVKESERVPRCIDYACGAGHFLNEYARQIAPFVKQYKETDLKEYHKAITGIEKEYRLSKVAKVSALMYGEDDINIVYNDALAANEKIANGSYNVLIANPPYSVKGFLDTLSRKERENFTLSEYANLQKSNAIEAFFVERASQLLDSKGVAGIILPVSVLNKSGIYTKCREIILKSFQIVAIVEFGSGTFGKTGTNTITLFLRRRGDNPAEEVLYKERINSWFSGDYTRDGFYGDKGMIAEYCKMEGYDLAEYQRFMKGGEPPEEDIFNEYRTILFEGKKSSFSGMDEAKKVLDSAQNRLNTKAFRAMEEKEQEREKKRLFRNFAVEIEKEKLYYFMLAQSNGSDVIVAQSPAKTADMKAFLGYEWSGRKGNEGIKYIGYSEKKIASNEDGEAEEDNTIEMLSGIGHIKTPLFNPQNLYGDREKINTLIRENFLRKAVTIPNSLESFVKCVPLCDMIDFKGVAFNKEIKTSGATSGGELGNTGLVVSGKWEVKKLGEVAEMYQPKTISGNEILRQGKYKVFGANGVIGYYNKYNHENAEITMACRGTCGTINYTEPQSWITGNAMVIRPKIKDVLQKFLLYYLPTVDLVSGGIITGTVQPQITRANLSLLKIPLPSIDIQQKIVAECESVDNEYNIAEESIKQGNETLSQLFANVKGEKLQLREVVEIQSRRIGISQINAEDYITTDNMLQNREGVVPYTGATDKLDKVIEYQADDILLSNIRPYLKKIWLSNHNGGCSADVLVIRVKNGLMKPITPKFLFRLLWQDTFFDYVMSGVKGMKMPRGDKDYMLKYDISIPPISEQNTLVAKAEAIEAKIAEARKTMAGCADKKKAVLEKYL